MAGESPTKVSIVHIGNSIDWERQQYRKDLLGSVFAIVGEYNEEEEGDPEQPNFGLKTDPRAICFLEFADNKIANDVASGLLELLRRLGHDVEQSVWPED